MRLRQIAALILGGLLLSFFYYWLVAELVGYSAIVPKPHWWVNLTPVIGRYAAALAWLEILNTGAMILAALLVSVPAVIVLRQGALLVVTVAAIAVAAFSVGESVGVVAGAGLHQDHFAVLVADTIKLAVLPGVLVLALLRWPSNTRWSGPPVNKVPVPGPDAPHVSGPRAAAQLHR